MATTATDKFNMLSPKYSLKTKHNQNSPFNMTSNDLNLNGSSLTSIDVIT